MKQKKTAKVQKVCSNFHHGFNLTALELTLNSNFRHFVEVQTKSAELKTNDNIMLKKKPQDDKLVSK